MGYIATSLLFADDYIPDDNLSDNDIKTDQSRFMRQTVQALRSVDYEVTVARTHEEALNLIKKLHFDIAIIDLHWSDKSIPNADRLTYGWNISDAIDEMDKKLSKKTLQIIYSAQFQYDPSISTRAAEKGKLPLYKTYGEVDPHALKAVVRFIEKNLTIPSVKEQFDHDRINELRQLLNQYREEPLKQQRRWFNLTFLLVALSIFLLIAGATGAIFWSLQVGILTSVSSIMTGAISSLLYVQLQREQEKVEQIRKNIEHDLNEKVNQFIEEKPTKTAPSHKI